jgi:hypothetical protein
MASIILRIILMLMLLGAISAAWHEPEFVWVAGMFLGMLALTFVRFHADEKKIHTNKLPEPEKITKLNHSLSERFNKYLQSLPPEPRLKAIDERFGGMLTKLAATPEFKRAEEEFRQEFEKRLKPILDTLETPGPLSFSAQNQLEAKFKELEKELSIKKLKE